MEEQAAAGGRYRIEASLGHGGMAEVFRAVDTRTGEQVALKRLRPFSDRRQSRMTALFQREYHTLAQIAHPAVIRVFDYGIDEEGPYYTMELLDGRDLSQHQERLPHALVCALLYDVASSLALLHARRLVHRDVTSRNIRVISDDHAKLLDFGALMPMGPCEDVVGTPAYVAPEALLGQPLDGRADLYALGVALYRALTGRVPYRAGTLAGLRQAWRTKPPPVRVFAPEVPAELDRLTMAMISLREHARPRDAAEVMERLATIGGLQRTAHESVERAYLVTPTLVGRKEALGEIRERLVRAMRSSAAGLLLRGPAGVGRSRMVDAAVIEAKVMGATVLRGRIGSGRGGPLATAQALLDQLRERAPEQVEACAADPRCALLFDDDRAGLEDLTRVDEDRPAMMAALSALLEGVARERALLITVDDLHELDDASLGLLASLAVAPHPRRLLIIASETHRPPADDDLPLRVLHQHLEAVELEPLSAEQTRALLRSTFGKVANLDAVSSRVHDISGGLPRDVVALAEHLIDAGLVRHEAGAWVLPPSLPADALPDGVTDTLRSRLQALQPGSRQLAAAFALSGRQSMALEELLCLTGCDTPGEAHAALEALVAADVLISDNDDYAFRHAGWATPVLETLDPSARRTRHAELAAFYERGDTDPLASVHHRLLANEPRRALSTLEPFLMERDVHAANIFSLTGLSPEKLGTLFDMALRVAEEHGASPRVLGRLRHFVLAMGVMVDERWFLQLAPDVGEFLKRESGWYAWQETDPSASPMDRVVAAIGQAQAAYDAAPDDAAYAPGEAIRQLVQHAVASIAVGVRASDLPMLEGLPALLEPFAPLTPIVNTIYENTIATWDSALGRHESARERYQAVLERLQDVDVAALEHADEIRDAVTYGIATAEVRMGLPSADQWLDRLSHNPRYGVSRLILRSVLAMQAGDWSTADALRGQAELLLLQSDATQLFGSSDVRLELEARAVALDLRAVKQLLPRVEALAAKMPGWSAYMHLARGELARLRGDGSRALAEYDESIAVATEGDWEAPSLSFHTAAAAKLEMLVELGRAEEALPLGRRYLALDAEAPPGVRLHGIWRAMALAHAQQGDGEAAQALMSQLHAAREALGGSSMHLGLLHEADTLIALWTGDATGAATALKKTAECFLAHGGAGFGARYGRLLGETRNSMAGAAIPGDSAPPTGTTATETAATRVGELMTSLTDARLRAARGLELLCEQAGATGGHLYLQQPEGLALAASLGQSPPPDDLQAFVQQCFQAEVTGLDGPTETATMTAAGPIGGTLLATDGRRYHPMWIRARLGGATSLLGVAALLLDDRAAPDLSAYEVAAALGDHLLQTGDAITACSS